MSQFCIFQLQDHRLILWTWPIYISGTAEGSKIWLERTASNKKNSHHFHVLKNPKDRVRKGSKITSNQVVPTVLSGSAGPANKSSQIALLYTDKYTSAGTLHSFR